MVEVYDDDNEQCSSEDKIYRQGRGETEFQYQRQGNECHGQFNQGVLPGDWCSAVAALSLAAE